MSTTDQTTLHDLCQDRGWAFSYKTFDATVPQYTARVSVTDTATGFPVGDYWADEKTATEADAEGVAARVALASLGLALNDPNRPRAVRTPTADHTALQLIPSSPAPTWQSPKSLPTDYISILNLFQQANRGPAPEYHPNGFGTYFECECRISTHSFGEVLGRSVVGFSTKKEAKQSAAQDAVTLLRAKGARI